MFWNGFFCEAEVEMCSVCEQNKTDQFVKQHLFTRKMKIQ